MKRLIPLLSIVLIVAFVFWFIFETNGDQDQGNANGRPIQQFAPIEADQGVVLLSQFDDLQLAQPSSIDLQGKLETPAEFQSQYDAWINGEIDFEGIEGPISEAERETIAQFSFDLSSSESILNLDDIDTANFELAQNFESMDISECCGGGANVPPDPDLAVGPNHVVAAVNVAFEIYSKSGDVLVPATTFAALFSNPTVDGCTKTLFDPNVLYDEEADRFLLGIDGGASRYCLAVSKTSDPTGVWTRYSFPTNVSGLAFDYPQAGVGRDAIYMGANMFIPGGNFAEARIWAFDKWAMYSAEPVPFRSLKVLRSTANPPVEDTPQPAHYHGFDQGTWPATGPHYILTQSNYSIADKYSLFSWLDPFGSNQLSYLGTVNLTSATGVPVGLPVPVPQLGGDKITANDARLQDAEFRNGSLWTVDSVACNPGGGIVNCIRWAQIQPSPVKVLQAGVIASSGRYRFFGDLAANDCNDMAVGYTKSGPFQFPDIWIAGLSGENGQLGAEELLKDGEIAYSAFDTEPHRWGDYTGMTSDPNGRDFWYIGQYSKVTQDFRGRWGTYVGCIRTASCQPGSSANIDENSPQISVITLDFNHVYLPVVSSREFQQCGYVNN